MNLKSDFNLISVSGFKKLSLKAGFCILLLIIPLLTFACTLTVSLTAIPSSGIAPLNGVDLKATVGGGATGPITYKFDCTNDGSWDYTFTNVSDNPKTVVAACNYPAAGTYTAKVQAERDSAAPAQAFTQIVVSAPPAPAPSADIKANNSDGPITIDYNTSATLSWTSTNANSCTASGDWSGAKSTSGSQSTGNLTSSKTYTITCTGAGGSISDSVTVNVSSLPTLYVSLEAIPNSGTVPLNNVDLRATVSGSASGPITYKFDCTNNGNWEYIFNNISDNPKTVVDACNYSTIGTYTAKVQAERNSSAPAQAFTQIVVSPPSLPVVDIKANNSDGPVTVDYNTAAVLTWTSTNATYCSGSGSWSGVKLTSGSLSTGNLVSSKTYTITCSGPGGSNSDSVTVNIGSLPTLYVTLEAIPASGQAPLYNVDLKATVSGTAQGTITYKFDCNNDGYFEYRYSNSTENPKTAVDACDYYNIGTYTAKVVAERAGITADNTATIYVSQTSLPGQTLPPVISFRAENYTVDYNSSTLLFWNSENTTRCYASDGWTGNKATYGSQSTGKLTFTKNFTITCTGPGGIASKSVTVEVWQRYPTVDLKVNGTDGYTRINYNTAAILTWTSSNAKSCSASGGWSGTKSTVNGSQSTGKLTSDQIYTITCSNQNGIVDDTVTVGVNSVSASIVSVASAATSPQGGVINLSIVKSVRNITTNTGFSDQVSAKPSDILEFSIRVTSGGNSIAQNVMVRDFLPSSIIYQGGLNLDGVSYNGDILAGFSAGSFFPGQPKTITFRATVASDSQFAYGTTNLINTAMAYNTNASISDTARVSVTRTGVLGAATEVGTGISEKLRDYIFLPFLVALLITLVFKRYLILADDWMEEKRDKTFKTFSQRQLEKTILKAKSRERI